MNKRFWEILFAIFLFVQPVFSQSSRLPRVLIVTSGDGDGRGTVSDGIVLAMETFHLQGLTTRLHDRSILYEPERLKNFDILILSSLKSYHDADRPNGLSFMSEAEIQNIRQFVRNGGILIADLNVGRNTLSGKDRLASAHDDYPLIPVREVKEFNLKGARLISQIYDHPKSIFGVNDEAWLPVLISPGKTLIYWKTNNQQLPALSVVNYGKGKAFFLSDFRILHPSDDGGWSTPGELKKIYRLILKTAGKELPFGLQFSPWKNGHTSAYCQTFDDGGNKQQYQRIFKLINRFKLPTVFFVTPNIDPEIQREIKAQKHIDIQGHSFTHPDFRKLDYWQTANEFYQNAAYWNKKFTGFRFPYVSNSFYGMYWLNRLGFLYDTSIAVNHDDFIRGSVVPYNIPVFKNDFFLTLDLIEISQMYRSDWYFYQKSLEDGPYTGEMQQKDARRFARYLHHYFFDIIQPRQGVMVYLGHPMYSGYSDITLQPLEEFLQQLSNENVWITSLNTLAKRWKTWQNLEIKIQRHDNVIRFRFSGGSLEGFSLFMDQKPKSVEYQGKFQLKKSENRYVLIFDMQEGKTLTLTF